MEPNSPFQMQYYDQGHGNSNGFPPSYSQSPGMSSPNNSLSSQTPPYAFRGMENGMSRFMADQFDSQNFQQHPNQFYQQQQNMRRNDGNFPYKSQLGSQQGFPNQQGNFVANHDSFSNATYNSFLPSNMKGRMPSDSDMFSSSAQSFSQARQNFTTSVSRDPFGNQMAMGMMEGGMPQQSPMGPQMPGQPPEYPPQYQQYQNRNDFGRNQFYGPDGGFRSNGMRPDGFGQAFSQSPSPQTPTQGPMDQRPTSMYSPVGPGYPVNQPKSLSNAQPIPSENQRQAAIMAAAAVRAAAAASSRSARDFPPGTGYPNTYQYGPRGFVSPDMMGSPFNNTGNGNGIQSPPTKDFPPASPLGPNLPRQTANFADSPMSQGRGSANSVTFSPNVEQSGFGSPGFTGQQKVPTTSPSVRKKSPSSEGLKQNLSPSHCQNSGAEVKIKKEANVAENCTASQGDDSIMSNDLDEAALNDAEELLKSAGEKTEDVDTPVKKENESEDSKTSIDEASSEEKPQQDEPEKNLLIAPANKSSAPPTPLSGISPSSSPFPEDLDIASVSPSWPNTPTSPTTKRLLQSRSPARFDQLSKLYDLSEDEERRNFLDKYLAFMSVNGTPITKVPIVCKQPLDLYRLFRAVLIRGGLQEVMKKKQFREVLKSIDLSSTNASLAYTVKNQYTKYLLPFETKMKDSFLRAWQKDIMSKSSEKPVPTIVLNDTLPSAQQMSKLQQMAATSGMGQDAGLRDWQMSMADAPNQFQMNNQMQMSQSNVISSAMSNNQPRQAYPGRTSYGSNPDMGYPMNSFMRFQRPNFQRNQNQGYGGGQSFPSSMPQNPMQNPLSPSWPRNFPQRPVSGPPELFPEGLQRAPWSQPQPSMNRAQHPQAYLNEKQRLSSKMKGYQSSMKDQNSPWPTNKGPNIPLKPKRSSTPVTGDHTSQSQKSSVHSALKREPLVFPPDSVENTKPVLNKRHKLTSKELGPVEAWRIMMSLKSGMLAECTWAIDTLNILLHDDKTISYFHLPQLPGLLDTLMDHFRRCCMDAFKILRDVEASMQFEKELDTVSDEKQKVLGGKRSRKEALNELWIGLVKHAKSSYSATVASNSIEEGEEDVCNLTESTWKEGGGDDTSHIQLSFPPRSADIRPYPSKKYDSDKAAKNEGHSMNDVKEGEDKAEYNMKEDTQGRLSKRISKLMGGKIDSCSDMLAGKTESVSKIDNKGKVFDPCTRFNHVKPSFQSKVGKNSISQSMNDSENAKENLEPELTNRCNGNVDEKSGKSEEWEKLGKQTEANGGDRDATSLLAEEETKVEGNKGKNISANLTACESFKAMAYLEEGLNEAKPVLHETVEEICTSLELDTDYTKQYLDTSKEFICYLKNRLTAENRGKVPSQEAFAPENSPFHLQNDHEESIFARLIAVSNIFRSLSFVSGNDNDLASHPGLLLLMGKLLIYKHEHPVTDHSEFRLTQEDSDAETCEANNDGYDRVCLDGLKAVRENILVMLANVAGQMDLSRYPEHIIFPLLDGLLHWVVCQSSEARDPMPTAPSKYALSPKRLALESLAKLSITDNNVDLILATPPSTRLKDLFKELVKAIGIKSSIPVREFAVVVLDNLSHGDNIISTIIEQKSCIGNILLFLEEAEKNTSSYVSGGGVVQPGLSAEDVCGTSVNMLRRAADILLCLARGIVDRSPFLPYVHRLLALATSQMMDTSVLKILSDIMYELR